MLSLSSATPFDIGTVITEFLMNWWLQSTLLIAVGLLIGGWLKARGAALQSVVYRMTLVAALLCPLATWLLAINGVSGWSVKLPSARMTRSPESSQTHAGESVAGGTTLMSATNRLSERDPGETTEQRGLPMSNQYPATMPFNDSSIIDTHAAMSTVKTIGGMATDAMRPTTNQDVKQASLHPTAWLTMVVCGLWMAFSLVLSIRLIRAWSRLGWLRRHSLPADLETDRLCRELASTIGVRTPEVRHSPYIPSPFLAGLQRPVVLLPEPDQALRMREVLIHELAHLRRRDCDWNLLLQCATSAFFFQPLLWALGRRIEATAEDVCDDYVVRFGGDRTEYAHQLADIAERRLVPSMVLGVGMMSLRSMLGRRVARIMDGSRALSTRVGNLLIVVVFLGGFAATMTAGLIGLASRPTLAENKPAKKSERVDQPKIAEKDDLPAQDAKETRLAANNASTTESKSDAGEKKINYYEGQVVDPDGKPVAGAKLHLVNFDYDPLGQLPVEWKPIAETDAQGKFRFSQNVDDTEDPTPFKWGGMLCAASEGYGFAMAAAAVCDTDKQVVQSIREKIAKLPREFQELFNKQFDRVGQPLMLKVDDEPIRGQVVNINGEPVVGSKVTVVGVHTGPDERLDNWLKKVTEERADLVTTYIEIMNRADGSRIRALVHPVMTDAQGNFVLKGVGRDRIAELMVEGSGIQTDRFFARTQTGERIEIPQQWSQPGSTRFTYHPSKFIHVAGPSQPIVGVVSDKDSGAPIVGATILSQKRHGHPITGAGEDFIRTVTDSEGKYRLEGMPIGNDNRIGVIPPRDRAYLSDSKSAKTTSDAKPMTIDFKLQPAIWVTGRITDRHTGQGLSGEISYYSFRDNPAGKRGWVDERRFLRADAEGRYQIAVPSGRSIIAFRTEQYEKYPRAVGAESIEGFKKDMGHFDTLPHFLVARDYHVLKEVNPVVGTGDVNLDISLDAANKLKGRVVDPSGKPLSTAFFSGKLKDIQIWDAVEPSGQFEVIDYEPVVTRQLAFFDTTRALSAFVTLSGPISDALVVKLEPAGKAKGRIVDELGDSIPNLQLMNWTPRKVEPTAMMQQSYSALPLPPSNPLKDRQEVLCDAEGRFELNGLLPGRDYRIRAYLPYDGKQLPAYKTGPLDIVINVKAGETQDLGDVRIADENAYTDKFLKAQKASLEKSNEARPGTETPSSK